MADLTDAAEQHIGDLIVSDCTQVLDGPCCNDGWHMAGVHFDDVEAGFVEGVLGFCGCGQPERVAGVMRTYLGLLNREERADMAEILATLGPDVVTADDDDAYTMWMLVAYLADKALLTNHGGAVFGAWITPLGAEWHQRLVEFDAQGGERPASATAAASSAEPTPARA